MRLTLRTLLAYLDDVLDPAETREIGQKIQESPMAANLISRIREVMRRRRLTAPELSGPGAGLDANLVARYLDNELSVEEVAEVERVCLGSDIHLAEVAACHQVLTLVLGDPVEVPENVRDRLFSLAVPNAAITAPARATQTRDEAPPASVTAQRTELPNSLRRRPWTERWLPGVALVALILVSFGLFLADRELIDSLMGRGIRNPSRFAATSDAATSVPARTVDPAAVARVAGLPKRSSPPASGQPAPVAVDPAFGAVDAAAPLNGDLSSAAPPETDVLMADALIPENPLTEAPADQSEPMSVDGQPPATTPTPAPEATKRETMAEFTSTDAMLLGRSELESASGWTLVASQSPLTEGTLVACPEPFEAGLELVGGAARLKLLGGTVIALLGPTNDQPGGLRLLRGRVVLESTRLDHAPTFLSMQLLGRSGRLELSDTGSRIAISLAAPLPSGVDLPPVAADRTADVIVVAGRGSWQWGDGRRVELGENSTLRLPSLGEPQPQPPSAGGVLPDWLDPQQHPTSAVVRKYAQAFQGEFDQSEPVELAAFALVKDGRPKIAELAVDLLGLIDNPVGLTQSLAQSPHEEARLAAALQLRQWLGREAKVGPTLRSGLERWYPAVDADVAYRLIWGWSLDDARDPTRSLELVELLRSPRVEFRELAIANLTSLTGKRYDYKPLATDSQRASAIRRWEDHVSREGALLARPATSGASTADPDDAPAPGDGAAPPAPTDPAVPPKP